MSMCQTTNKDTEIVLHGILFFIKYNFVFINILYFVCSLALFFKETFDYLNDRTVVRSTEATFKCVIPI